MKKITYLFFLFLVHFGFSQTQEDFEKNMKTIVESMKIDQTDKIFDMFSADLQKTLTKEKLKEIVGAAIKEFGKPIEFDFMLDDNGLRRYLIQTDRDSFMLDVAMSADLKINKLQIE
ncbi:hypothetical protein D1816_03175 [Aquimarina sp. AD10]|uniref:DUF3887 domain-containing protein n=1 Tax=Aquimarina aggregata TaxID=1642818 RepID=A0A163CP35_9FLAO|nr:MULTISPECIES: hypothetical protein [Aquimarina]AXT59392.1 hypothetical protein D1816_03175 [Aquimarina sp. AD10]KZS42613.1 hypothetical protein AWE51_03975 [Aquimarina aggregata]RKM94163.1 hypothetical protein D7033_18690 [Aquimarina sp. AD10]